MKWLQGEWVAIAIRDEKRNLTPTELKDTNERVSVKGNQFITKRVGGGTLGTEEGRFELNASVDPKQFDWTGKSAAWGKYPGGKAIERVGVYEIDKDLGQFVLCCAKMRGGVSGKRPDSFDDNTAVCVTYRRAKE